MRILAAALLVLATACSGCGAHTLTLAEQDEIALSRYRAEPSQGTYLGFIGVNREAARVHGNNQDAEGIEYQLRALEVMAAESVRTKDAVLAGDVMDRLREMDDHDLVTAYEETVPGTKARLAKVRTEVDLLSR